MMTPGAKNVILGVACSAALTVIIGGGTWMIKEQIDTGKHLVKIDGVLDSIAKILDDTKSTIPQAAEKRFSAQDARMNLLEYKISHMESGRKAKDK